MARKKTNRSPQPEPTPTSPPEASKSKTAAAAPAMQAAHLRRQPVILRQPSHPTARCAELAGGTTADCVSVCCCCPCMAMNLVVLTTVRLPVGICRRAKKAHAKRRAKARKRKEAALLSPENSAGGDVRCSAVAAEEGDDPPAAAPREGGPTPAEVEELEKQIWALFHDAGFWRSMSQRESVSRD
ncbi:hypothetical protein Cni_G00427 [Canna indica]|uniref:Uncharacterized protein n=1 Tax=Canna indica TaxID=4628 RepID=A0AAQ3JMQ1_9LILI|nr:hypothetical protein Cni_G00427 [Canna indica]